MKRFFYISSATILILLMCIISANNVTDELTEKIFRLHIIANSNSEPDQDIKLRIRDEILNSDFNVIDGKSAADNLCMAENIANRLLAENNFPYGAKAYYGLFSFPKKSDGSITLPSGKYKGIKILLGSGCGRNWWCILSPPACLTDKTVSIDENALKSHLSKETYAVISEDCHFKLKGIELVKKYLKNNEFLP